MHSSKLLEGAVRRRAITLAVLGLLMFVPFLGGRDLWYPDEPDVGQVCQAMYESGDWIAPRRNGEIWVDYPPMIYWAGTISSHLLGGMSAFALRLPSALAAIALVLATAAMASRWFDARTGFWAGFLLLTFHHFAYEAVSYRPDMLFALALGAGAFAYVAGTGERPRLLLRALGFALFGLAILAKGPLGLLLPGLVLTLWHGARREWRSVLGLAPLALISLAVALPWYVACAKAMGADDIMSELYQQSFQRFVDGTRGHEKPFHYYLKNVWPDLAPWSPLLPFVLWWLFRSGRWRDRYVQLALWWFGAFFVFLSLAVTKRQIYLLPAYPAAALLLAPWIAALGRAEGERARVAPDPRPARALAAVVAGIFMLAGVSALVVGAAYEAILARLELEPLHAEVAAALRLPILALGAVCLAGGVWIAAGWRRLEAGALLARVGAAHVPLFVALAALVLPALDPVRSYARVASWLRAENGSEPRFGLADPDYGRRKMGAFTFYSGLLVEHLADEAAVDRYLREHPASLVLVNEAAVERVFTTPREQWKWSLVRELQVAKYRYLALGSAGRESAPLPQRP